MKEKGFSDELIAVLRDVICSIDPETNEKVRRIKEIMDYIDDIDKKH